MVQTSPNSPSARRTGVVTSVSRSRTKSVWRLSNGSEDASASGPVKSTKRPLGLAAWSRNR